MTINHPQIQDYRDFLDDVHEEVTICGYKYQASRALEMVDPIAFRVGFNDYLSWIDEMTEDMEYKDAKAS